MYEIHLVATWLHIVSAVYWVGAILFVISVLGPVLRKKPAGVAIPILTEVQGRVRSFVLIAIITFIVTGFYNLHYRGGMDLDFLMDNPYGQTFLIKMVPVAIMFTIYFSAPAILRKMAPDSKGTCCEVEEKSEPVNKVFALLHIVALICGLIIIFLGVQLRG